MPDFLCVRCKHQKPEEEFYFCKKALRQGKPKRQSYCRSCNSEATLERQKNNKRHAVAYKGGSCVICGYKRCIEALQFHHVDPKEKDFGIGGAHLKRFENIKEELGELPNP